MKAFGTIYKITNILNGKSYIGLTTQPVLKRFRAHCWGKGGRSEIMPIRMAIKKYGKHNFALEEIYTAFTLDELNKAEKHFIQELNTLSPSGYNLCSGGEGSAGNTKDIKAKIAKSIKIKMAKKVVALNMITKEEIGFDSMAEASKHLKVKQGDISFICKHKKYSCNSWTFKFHDGEYPNPLNKKKSGRPVSWSLNENK